MKIKILIWLLLIGFDEVCYFVGIGGGSIFIVPAVLS
jgi:hypothetical protein